MFADLFSFPEPVVSMDVDYRRWGGGRKVMPLRYPRHYPHGLLRHLRHHAEGVRLGLVAQGHQLADLVRRTGVGAHGLNVL